MRTVRLGRTGLLKISEVCLGTMTFGLQTERDEAFAIMDVGGGRPGSTSSTSPTSIRSAGRSRRSGAPRRSSASGWRASATGSCVATKVYNPMGPGPNDTGNSRAARDRRVRRLAAPAADRLHRPVLHPSLGRRDADRRDARGVRRLAPRRQDPLRRLQQHRRLADDVGAVDVRTRPHRPLRRGAAALQPAVPRDRGELLPAAREYGVGAVVFNPLAGGVLTGKYKRGETPREGTRFTLGNAASLYQQRYWQDAQLDVVERLAADVASRGKSITHVALRWVLDQPGVTAAIVGASRAEQLRDSLGRSRSSSTTTTAARATRRGTRCRGGGPRRSADGDVRDASGGTAATRCWLLAARGARRAVRGARARASRRVAGRAVAIGALVFFGSEYTTHRFMFHAPPQQQRVRAEAAAPLALRSPRRARRGSACCSCRCGSRSRSPR